MVFRPIPSEVARWKGHQRRGGGGREQLTPPRGLVLALPHEWKQHIEIRCFLLPENKMGMKIRGGDR